MTVDSAGVDSRSSDANIREGTPFGRAIFGIGVMGTLIFSAPFVAGWIAFGQSLDSFVEGFDEVRLVLGEAFSSLAGASGPYQFATFSAVVVLALFAAMVREWPADDRSDAQRERFALLAVMIGAINVALVLAYAFADIDNWVANLLVSTAAAAIVGIMCAECASRADWHVGRTKARLERERLRLEGVEESVPREGKVWLSRWVKGRVIGTSVVWFFSALVLIALSSAMIPGPEWLLIAMGASAAILLSVTILVLPVVFAVHKKSGVFLGGLFGLFFGLPFLIAAILVIAQSSNWVASALSAAVIALGLFAIMFWTTPISLKSALRLEARKSVSDRIRFLHGQIKSLGVPVGPSEE